jgi:hypothetical protein
MRREKSDGKRQVETPKKWFVVGLGPAGPGLYPACCYEHGNDPLGPTKRREFQGSATQRDLVRKSGNLVEFHHICLITVLTPMVILLHVPRPGIMYHGQTTGKISYNLTAWMMIKRRTTTVFQLPASSS